MVLLANLNEAFNGPRDDNGSVNGSVNGSYPSSQTSSHSQTDQEVAAVNTNSRTQSHSHRAAPPPAVTVGGSEVTAAQREEVGGVFDLYDEAERGIILVHDLKVGTWLVVGCVTGCEWVCARVRVCECASVRVCACARVCACVRVQASLTLTLTLTLVLTILPPSTFTLT